MQSAELLQAIQSLLALRLTGETLLSLGIMRETLTTLLARVQHGDAKQALDLDFRIEDEIIKLWEFARDTYRQSQDPAIRESASATYTVAVQLQWAIAEHDIGLTPTKSGYVATSAEEVERVLDRIVSEK